jgi:photosystem II stability/assembly factor-like uncharacterized protein
MSNRMMIGTRKGLLIYEKDDSGWQVQSEHFVGIPVSNVRQDPRHSTLWALLDHGHWGTKLHRTTDYGTTWEEIPTPKYPEGATRPQDNEPANTTYLWLIQPGGEDEPERLYIGTEPGGLFVSDDGGETFALNEALWQHESRENWFGGGRDYPGLCSIIVDPRDSRHVTVGISVGGVYETRDGGQTWQGRNKGLYADYLPDPHSEYGHDPHYVLASPSNPDVLWQQNHCGVFRSVDAGTTWTNISQNDGPAYFGFALAVDERDENVAWVVPAISAEHRVPIDRALCVCRTDDGGQTWSDFRQGLPQENAYDIAFRHALDVDGDSLAFGTTAGNVFISEDRGESWQSIAHNLAVVYAVHYF